MRKLFLVQHGHALAKEVDSDRPLSKQGREDVGKVAALLGQRGVQVSRIVHSGKLRARQTAELFAEQLSERQPIESATGLAPGDAIEPWVTAVNDWTEDVMLVGHQPFMGKFVSRLVVGNPGVETVSYQPGTVVCLEKTTADAWVLAWMIRPELL